MYSVRGNDFTPLESYKGATTKIKMKCNKCNHEWYTKPNNILSGFNCPNCRNLSRYKTKEEFEKDVYKMFGDEYKLHSDFINIKDNVSILHNVCGNVFSMKPVNFLRKNDRVRCPLCRNKHKKPKVERKPNLKTPEEHLNKIKEVLGEDYIILGEYIKNNKKIKMKHLKCNNIFMARPYNLKRGYGCPYCKMPKGEMAISDFLEDRFIRYKTQHTFDDCRNANPLPFDFAVFEDDSLMLLIEYDGKGHYEPVNFGGISDKEAEEVHEQTRINDNIKNQYCKDNDIPLLRIPYWELDSVSQILEKDYWINSLLKLQYNK